MHVCIDREVYIQVSTATVIHKRQIHSSHDPQCFPQLSNGASHFLGYHVSSGAFLILTRWKYLEGRSLGPHGDRACAE